MYGVRAAGPTAVRGAPIFSGADCARNPGPQTGQHGVVRSLTASATGPVKTYEACLADVGTRELVAREIALRDSAAIQTSFTIPSHSGRSIGSFSFGAVNRLVRPMSVCGSRSTRESRKTKEGGSYQSSVRRIAVVVCVAVGAKRRSKGRLCGPESVALLFPAGPPALPEDFQETTLCIVRASVGPARLVGVLR